MIRQTIFTQSPEFRDDDGVGASISVCYDSDLGVTILSPLNSHPDSREIMEILRDTYRLPLVSAGDVQQFTRIRNMVLMILRRDIDACADTLWYSDNGKNYFQVYDDSPCDRATSGA